MSSLLDNITGVVFDMDNTIVNFDYWYKFKLMGACKYAERHLGLKDFDRVFWDTFEKHSVYYKYNFRDTLAKLGYDIALEPIIYKKFVEIHAEDIVYEGFNKFIDLIAPDKSIYILTNGYKETHEPRIKKLGLDQFNVTYAGGTKHPKPSGYYLDKLDLIPQKTLVIADDIRDLIYPKYMGYNCIQFNPKIVDKDIKTCYSYEEIINYLKE